MNKTLALFDFDGTITYKDSMLDFLRYSFGFRKFAKSLVKTLPFLVGYKLGLYSNVRAKERLLAQFVNGMSVKSFEQLAHDYSRTQLPTIIRQTALRKIRWHHAQGHELVVVTASIGAWLKPWCNQMQMSVVSSELEHKDNVLTGNLLGSNCYGEIKVIRIKQKYNLSEYENIYAYGDSRGDSEMLALANKPYYRKL